MIWIMVEKIGSTLSNHYSAIMGAMTGGFVALLDALPHMADGVTWSWVFKIVVGGMIGGGIGTIFRLFEKWLNSKTQNKRKKPKK